MIAPCIAQQLADLALSVLITPIHFRNCGGSVRHALHTSDVRPAQEQSHRRLPRRLMQYDAAGAGTWLDSPLTCRSSCNREPRRSAKIGVTGRACDAQPTRGKRHGIPAIRPYRLEGVRDWLRLLGNQRHLRPDRRGTVRPGRALARSMPASTASIPPKPTAWASPSRRSPARSAPADATSVSSPRSASAIRKHRTAATAAARGSWPRSSRACGISTPITSTSI